MQADVNLFRKKLIAILLSNYQNDVHLSPGLNNNIDMSPHQVDRGTCHSATPGFKTPQSVIGLSELAAIDYTGDTRSSKHSALDANIDGTCRNLQDVLDSAVDMDKELAEVFASAYVIVFYSCLKYLLSIVYAYIDV